MKYQRLRITNYRGVDSSEITFDPRGLTLVQGPNEAGKTSLGEAIGILFEYAASSKHSIIKAIRPVHRDAGPEIELEAESGPYRFTYCKRFHKKPETKLTITAPTPENHTGREAHDRAKEILAETLDINLWKALTIQQGDAIAQPDLAKQQSLSAALDKAAGGLPTDQVEEGLFERVTEEYGRFFTTTGKERLDLTQAQEQHEKAESTVIEIVDKLRGLDQDIDSVERLKTELTELKERKTGLTDEMDKQTEALHEIASLESQVSEVRLKLESTTKTAELAKRDKQEREDLIQMVEGTDKESQGIRESTVESMVSFDRAEKQFHTAQTALQQSDEKKKNAERLAAIRRADFDYYNNLLFLEQFGERKQRTDKARSNAAHAEKILSSNKMDQKTLKKIERAERDLLTVNARLETAAPRVKLRGLEPCDVTIDDEETTIERDEVRDLSVADRLRITIPDHIELEIVAGSSAEELTEQVTDARQALDAACRAAGVDDPESASRALEERREATRQIGEKERIEQENLRDLSYDELAEKLLQLEQTVPGYLVHRKTDPAIAADLESAKASWETSEAAQQGFQTEYVSAQSAVDAARRVRDEQRQEHQSAQIALRGLEKDLQQRQTRLENSRKDASDESLERAWNKAKKAVDSEQANADKAEASLDAKHPERIKALAETARDSLATLKKRHASAQIALTQVETRLKIHGEEGLHEKLLAARTHLETVASHKRSLVRRAMAAKRLFDTMREARDKARQAYVAPLKERVESLGRLVFDERFQVDINDNLQMISRTTGDITVPFESLSGGTKEQLSLIFRLACSMIVAEEGGMPLIMDDALGYTDPDRTQLMGAVLAKAAKQCQIVIFTCVPARYRNVGNAKVVSL